MTNALSVANPITLLINALNEVIKRCLLHLKGKSQVTLFDKVDFYI